MAVATPTPQPPALLRQAWGEEVAEALAVWVDEIVREKTVPRSEYQEVLTRLGILEHDVADIKVDLRGLRQEILGLRQEMNERFDRMHERFDQTYERMLVQTRWLIGSLALIGTVISILLAIGQFVR